MNKNKCDFQREQQLNTKGESTQSSAWWALSRAMAGHPARRGGAARAAPGLDSKGCRWTGHCSPRRAIATAVRIGCPCLTRPVRRAPISLAERCYRATAPLCGPPRRGCCRVLREPDPPRAQRTRALLHSLRRRVSCWPAALTPTRSGAGRCSVTSTRSR